MNIDAKLLLHILADGFTKVHDFLARGTATIHQYQRLLIVHSGTAQALSLPATLVDHPACRNLLVFLPHCPAP